VADEADMANDQVQKALDATMKTLNTKIKENDSGKCIWCGDPVKDKRRWCSAECRDEQERHS
jgi:RNA polymerase-binding transcription factor DksA